jgi:hypothetical protein
MALKSKQLQALAAKLSSQHNDAFSALTALGVPEKEAMNLVSAIPDVTDPGEIVRSALRSRNPGSRAKTLPGGPSGAVLINPSATDSKNTVNSAGPAAAVAPVMGQPQPPTAPIANRPNLRTFIPQKPAPPVQQPVSPAAAQTRAPISLKNFVPRPAAPKPEKPRIRVKAAGQRIPVAPIGGSSPEPAAPAKAPANAPVMIRTYDEYDQLAPGTEFVWPDGHVYRKPAQ